MPTSNPNYKLFQKKIFTLKESKIMLEEQLVNIRRNIWEPLRDFTKRYDIRCLSDTRCEIRNRKSRHIISGSKDKDNYIKVNNVTRDDDVVGSFKFHRLIMHHYFPQENENELQVDHINHDRSDNRLLNL